jgi:hypothetical protein
MTVREERVGPMRKRRAAVAIFAVVVTLGATGEVSGQEPPAKKEEKQMTAGQSKFYCNTKALNAADRSHHKELTDKLIAERRQIVETEKGYEFQYSPVSVSLAELAEWVATEGKCCPFFDFHIDLEREGKLLCLRLSGEEGIKPFIRSEFRVCPK